MLSEHISGRRVEGAASRSSMVIRAEPPVVMLTIALVARPDARHELHEHGDDPASARRSSGRGHADAAPRRRPRPPRSPRLRSPSGVTGRCGDIDGVWIEPVIAQEMMILRAMLHLVTLAPISPGRRAQVNAPPAAKFVWPKSGTADIERRRRGVRPLPTACVSRCGQRAIFCEDRARCPRSGNRREFVWPNPRTADIERRRRGVRLSPSRLRLQMRTARNPLRRSR